MGLDSTSYIPLFFICMCMLLWLIKYKSFKYITYVVHINHRNPLTGCGAFPPCESCWRVSLPVQKDRDFFLPRPSKPGHGDVTWNQPIETPSRALKLEWVTQNDRDRDHSGSSGGHSSYIWRPRAAGPAGWGRLKQWPIYGLHAHQWSPHQTVPKVWFCL